MPESLPPFASVRARRWFWIAVVSLLALHALLVWLTRAPILSPDSNDYGLYLMLSRALQHLSYRDLHLVGAPIESQYPPGYPLLLAGAGALTGNSLDGAQAITVLCSVMALFFLCDLTRRVAGPAAALAVLLILALNNNLQIYSGRILAEMPYLALSAAVLWVAACEGLDRRRLIAMGVLAIAAALTRSTGVALVGAVGLLWLLERRWRAVIGFGVGAAATVGAWFVWTAVAPDKIVARSYVAAVMSSEPRASAGSVLLLRVMRAIQIYPKNTLAALEFPSLPGTVLDNLAGVIILLTLSAAGLVWLWRQRQRLPALYVACFVAVLIIYPFKNSRFLIPLLPVLVVAMVTALDGFGRRWGSRGGALACACLAVPLALNSLARLPDRLTTARACRGTELSPTPGCLSPAEAAYLGAVHFAQTTLPKGAIVVTTKEAVFHVLTGLMVFHPGRVRGNSGVEAMQFLRDRGVGYILFSAYPDGVTIAPSLGVGCRHLELVFTAEPDTHLFRILPADSTAPDSAACQAVASSVAALEERRKSKGPT